MEDILLVHRKSNRNFAESLQGHAVWKTCLRQILFCNEMDFQTLSDDIETTDYVLRGEKALSLLLEILCGLHSPIVGETEVFGQFKNFVDARKSSGDTLFGDHQKWLQFIFAEVKKTRAEHLVGLGSQSYGSLLRRHSKELDSVTVCGSGHLALEILPWLAHKKTVQVMCRTPEKIQDFTEKFNNVVVSKYSDAPLHGEALVIAAPLSDAKIVDLLQRQDSIPQTIFDLRGEENNLEQTVLKQFPHIKTLSLQQFFAEMEEIRKETQNKIEELKRYLYEKAVAFMQRTELRPLGWDDICA